MKDLLLRLLGGTDNMIYALTMFVVMNYITAILVAIVEKKWIKRKLGLKAIFGKIGIIVLICIANIIDTMIIGNDSTIRTTVISFYLSKEGFAILDNLEHLGVPLPPIIVKIIKQLNSEENNEENNEEDGEEGIEENSD
ncbi:toxin secretion/phage lysis holin [Lachnospiraceae bacterium MD335]|nr:toxin secretion/phage lysis holin [Lachnospiraceae bacterium MD335]